MTDEEFVAATAAKAKQLLFEKDGKPKGYGHFLAVLTMCTILRPATAKQKVKPGLGQALFDWHGVIYTYDAGVAVLFLDDARKGDPIADRLLCNAAAVLLGETGGIADPQLRKYAAERLSGDIQISPKRGRGRSAATNVYRNTAIANALIPPLLADFRATRNEATFDQECACSIVSKALRRLGIILSERRLAEIWANFSDRIVAK